MKYRCYVDDKKYVIEEDTVGWYLIVFNIKDDRSIEDYLLDSLSEAFVEAKDRFNIPQDKWEKIDSQFLDN